MVLTMIRLKPVADKTSVTVHFLELDQSFGLRIEWIVQLFCMVPKIFNRARLTSLHREALRR